MSPLFGSQLGKIVDGVNDEIVEGENRSNNITFVSKKLKNAKSKNLTYIWDFRAMEELIFLTPVLGKLLIN